MPEIKTNLWNGRKVKREVIIERGEVTADVPFVALYKAMEYLKMNAMSSGSVDRDVDTMKENPVGFMLGRYTVPQKWHNMDTTDKKKLDGVMISDDFRNGDLKIIIFK